MLRQRVAIQIKMPAALANQARLEGIGGARRNISPEIILQKAARLGLVQIQARERIGQVRRVRAAAPEKQAQEEQDRNHPRKKRLYAAAAITHGLGITIYSQAVLHRVCPAYDPLPDPAPSEGAASK